MDEQSARPSNDYLTVGDRLGGSVGALEIRRGGGGGEKIPYHSKVRGDLEEEFHTMPYQYTMPCHGTRRPRKYHTIVLGGLENLLSTSVAW